MRHELCGYSTASVRNELPELRQDHGLPAAEDVTELCCSFTLCGNEAPQHRRLRQRISILDLDPAGDDQEAVTCAANCAVELFRRDAAEVAIRQQRIYRSRIEPLVVGKASAEIVGPCLIAGGQGGLGQVLVSFLRTLGVDQITVLGRRPGHVKEADFVCADISQRHTTEAVLRSMRQGNRLPKMIFQLAGELADSSLKHLTWQTFERPLKPKVYGSQHLHEVEGASLVLFSSMASLLPFPDQINHAAANSFQDALAHERSYAGKLGLAINWSLWAETGAASEKQSALVLGQRFGFGAMNNKDALNYLHQVLSTPLVQVAICPVDWKAYLKAAITPDRTLQHLDEGGTTRMTGKIQRPEISDDLDLGAVLHQKLVQILQDVMGTDMVELDMDEQTSFETLGMDSMYASSFASRISSMGIEVETADVLSAPNVMALSQALLDRRGKLPEVHTASSLQDFPPPPQGISVVGMGIRTSSSSTPSEFGWQLWWGCGVWSVPCSRQSLYEDVPGIFVRHAGLLEDLEAFDEEFFGIRDEQRLMDPQQMLVLQCAQEAAVHKQRDVAVFIGVGSSENVENADKILRESSKNQAGLCALGNNRSVAANRVSHVFGLSGPSMSLDTACSSSLFAVATACSSLRNGEVHGSLAGGVNVILSANLMRWYSSMEMISRSGCCRSFDASADGMVRSEGCGVIALSTSEPLHHAEILGYATNHNAGARRAVGASGTRSEAMMMPSARAQQELLRAALLQAQQPEVQLMEAHGTGTPLGDPEEAAAIAATSHRVFVGAGKSILGHHEAAAGIMGLMKVISSFTRRCAPPNQHLRILNENIEAESLEFLNSHLPLGSVAAAGVNSFGFSGSNAHVLLAPSDCNSDPAGIDSLGFSKSNAHVLLASSDCISDAAGVDSFGFSESNAHVLLASSDCISDAAGVDSFGFSENNAHVLLAPSDCNSDLASVRAPVPCPNTSESLPQELLEAISDVLDLRPEELDISATFFDNGGDSISAPIVQTGLRRLGLSVRMDQLWDCSLSELLGSELKEEAIRRSGHPSAPFPLTPIQEAYCYGREFNDVAAHGYMEVEVLEDFDQDRFVSAFRKLFERHDMLRMKVLELPDGYRQCICRSEHWDCEVIDLTQISPEAALRELDRMRDNFSHEVIPITSWPLFRIRISRCRNAKGSLQSRLHFSFDSLLLDMMSLRILFSEWHALYEGTPDLPKLKLGFRDWVMWLQEQEATPRYQKAKEYWEQRYQSMPGAPNLRLLTNPSTLQRPRFQRCLNLIPAVVWKTLTSSARRCGVTATSCLLTCFAAVLARWCDLSPPNLQEFVINLTTFSRDHQLEGIIGDFTSVVLVAVNHAAFGKESFKKSVEAVWKQLKKDLSNSLYDGVHVQRGLRQCGSSSAPIVFTSLLNLPLDAGDRESVGQKFGEAVYSVTQTPQVWLDFKAFIAQDGCLAVEWDYVPDILSQQHVQAMHSAFCRLVCLVANDFEQPLPEVLGDEHLDAWLRLNATRRDWTEAQCPSTLQEALWRKLAQDRAQL
ncbi:unnamed protein product [Effrenium voratum]|nr:unnamed protein product [Effrenium voratum]